MRLIERRSLVWIKSTFYKKKKQLIEILLVTRYIIHYVDISVVCIVVYVANGFNNRTIRFDGSPCVFNTFQSSCELC